MIRVGLVACSAVKLDRAAPAAELYASDLFRKASALASRSCSHWFVLSALHGLVHPDDQVEPYDVTLAHMTPPERLAWGRRVADQLGARGLRGAHLVAFAGSKYVGPLVAAGLVVNEWPVEGLGIGRQLQFCKRELERGARDRDRVR